MVFSFVLILNQSKRSLKQSFFLWEACLQDDEELLDEDDEEPS